MDAVREVAPQMPETGLPAEQEDGEGEDQEVF